MFDISFYRLDFSGANLNSVSALQAEFTINLYTRKSFSFPFLSLWGDCGHVGQYDSPQLVLRPSY